MSVRGSQQASKNSVTDFIKRRAAQVKFERSFTCCSCLDREEVFYDNAEGSWYPIARFVAPIAGFTYDNRPCGNEGNGRRSESINKYTFER